MIRHSDSIAKANEELRLYRDDDATSEIAYQKWSYLHAELAVALTRIAELGSEECRRAKVEPGGIVYLWADAIASYVYDKHHD